MVVRARVCLVGYKRQRLVITVKGGPGFIGPRIPTYHSTKLMSRFMDTFGPRGHNSKDCYVQEKRGEVEKRFKQGGQKGASRNQISRNKIYEDFCMRCALRKICSEGREFEEVKTSMKSSEK